GGNNISYTYYENYNSGILSNVIINPTSFNTTPVTFVYVEVQDNDTGCTDVAQISLEYSSPPQIDDNLTITACEEIEGENKANFDLIEVYNHYADSNLDVKGYKDEDLTDPITNADDPNAYHANNND